MKFVQDEFSSTIEIKKSKFIAHLVPYSCYDDLITRLKKQHPKARHFVYAYRYLNQYEQIVENSSDDGEPKGTSGRPSLAVLQGANIINSAVVIVRYFGGIKLGTGGLVKAYSDAVNQVVKEAVFENYEKLIQKTIQVSYHDFSKMKYKLQQQNIKIIDQQFDDKITLTIESTEEKLSFFGKI